MYQLNKIYAALAIFLSVSAGVAANDCSDINIVSNQGRFVSLDSDSLDIKDVGNLRWFGVNGVDAAIQSDIGKHVALYMDYMFDFQTNEVVKSKAPIVIPSLNAGVSPGEAITLPKDLYINNTKWIEDSDTFVALRRQSINIADLFLYDAKNGVGSTYEGLNIGVTGDIAACKIKDTIYYSGNKVVAKIRDGKVEYTYLPNGYGKQGYITGATDHCHALFLTRRIKDEKFSAIYRVIDLVENNVTAEFKMRIDAKQYLYEGGRLLAQQQLYYEIPKENPNSAKVHPTMQFRVIDTQKGETIKEVILDQDYGVSDKLICKKEQPALVLKEPYRIHLFDLESMAIKASANLPFEVFYVL